MTASDRRAEHYDPHQGLATLARSYQLFDRPGVLELLTAQPTLRAALARLRVAIGACVGSDAVALVDTVRAARTGEVVGLLLMVQPAPASDGAGYERLVNWWRRRGTRDARARIALGVLPARRAANDNALDEG